MEEHGTFREFYGFHDKLQHLQVRIKWCSLDVLAISVSECLQCWSSFTLVELYPSITYCLQDQSKWGNKATSHRFKAIPNRTKTLSGKQNKRRASSRWKQFLPVHLRTEQQPVNLFQRAGPTTQCKNRSDMLNLQETKCKRELPHRNKKLPQEQHLS